MGDSGLQSVMNKNAVSGREATDMLRLFLAGVALIFIIDCDDDKKIQMPPMPEQPYDGEYIVSFISQGNGDSVLNQWIEWTFSDRMFWMEVTRTDERPKIFCNAVGYYLVTDVVTFSNLSYESDLCNATDLPRGDFRLRIVRDSKLVDSILMEQTLNDIHKEIRLARR